MKDKELQDQLYDPQKKKFGLTFDLPPRQWFDAMRDGIRRSSKASNPNPTAVTMNIWKRLSPEKRKEIIRLSANGKIYKYNLPVPDDKKTKGAGTLRLVKPFRLAEVQVNVSSNDMKDVIESGIFKTMKRADGTICHVARCKSKDRNVNIFVDKYEVK